MDSLISVSNVQTSSISIGRAVAVILGSRQRDLDASFSQICRSYQRRNGGLLECLRKLRRFACICVERGEPLDEVLIPMIEHAVKSSSSKNCKKICSILCWLFEDEDLFGALSTNLTSIIVKKEDHYIALGWCKLIQYLVDHEIMSNQYSDGGKLHRSFDLVKSLCQCIPHLSSIVCKGSILQDDFALPTRLSMAAADCILVLTGALVGYPQISKALSNRKTLYDSNASREIVVSTPTSSERDGSSASTSLHGSEPMEMGLLLWNLLGELVVLVQKLQAWSKKSRPLHAKGLGQVLAWLQELREYCGSTLDETGKQMPDTGILLLSSCWKHYVKLLRLDDHTFSVNFMELLKQYIAGLQLYTQQDEAEDYPGGKDSPVETRKFFLCCIALLWGRLNNERLELAMSKTGPEFLSILLAQLRCRDNVLVEGGVDILRKMIFKSNFSISADTEFDSGQIKVVVDLLLNLLDERDSVARAVVLLISECCSINPDGQCLQEIFKRLDSGNYSQRSNALDVISEFMSICCVSRKALIPSLRQNIALHLLECLGDDELIIRDKVSRLLSQLDPEFVFPPLLLCVYSSDEKMQSAASEAILAVLKGHEQTCDVVVALLDSLRNISQSPAIPESQGGLRECIPSRVKTSQSGTKVDIDQVLQLVPKWSESVQDWRTLIEVLLEKILADPSNAILLRFLGYINEQLAEARDLLLHRVLLHMQAQKELNEDMISKWADGDSHSANGLKESLFDRLCPLLILRMLPLRVFSDLSSSTLYGHLQFSHGHSSFDPDSTGCITTFLIHRAFLLLEFEDVRKVAAEVSGRLHPQVILPIIGDLLENATVSRDLLKMRACLFATCTSLLVWGKESVVHPVMVQIRKYMELALKWPSLDSDEVSKAQHGCIDCLAFMICAELEALVSPTNSDVLNKTDPLNESQSHLRDTLENGLVLSYVIQNLICHKNVRSFTSLEDTQAKIEPLDSSPIERGGSLFKGSAPLPFHLCMANVLISACQKMPPLAKPLFAQRALPPLIHFVKVVMEQPEMKAACLQVLFTAVYHLKSAVLPYATDLFSLSMKALKTKGATKERIAGTKLIASLMASDDAILKSISAGLLEARSVLASVSLMDSSPELQGLCEKLLSFITSPLNNDVRSALQLG
ncbi:uncharacterized protein LOC18439992 isoform X1 [Amborella trichopoda]|uniref:uncharacterized protein LOC18439992 isoform X1 n=3 Tax=Amborella trichopoda TaxID=13333 RepID=UPI0009BF4552|nr:uncharacterized protein LOC18439992 isoform X1 [Amborella trichopoda]|eukprot:XP_020526344.1 uncharacterized protein LOC18439992 isoform X1 [Amborella trichopoda]